MALLTRVFACVLPGRCGLVRGRGGTAAQSGRNAQERTGSSVEALLAESVAGQISWRAVCGGVAHYNKGLRAHRRLRGSYQPPNFSRSTSFPPHNLSLSLSYLSLSLSIAETKRGATFLPSQTDRNLEGMMAPLSAM